MKKTIFTAASLAVLFSGCATIIDGASQNINLTSAETKKVTIGNQTYTSPGVVSIKRSDEDAIVKVENCNKDILLKKEVNPTFFINILSGGAFGSTTDYASKSMWQYDTTNLNVDCK